MKTPGVSLVRCSDSGETMRLADSGASGTVSSEATETVSSAFAKASSVSTRSMAETLPVSARKPAVSPV